MYVCIKWSRKGRLRAGKDDDEAEDASEEGQRESSNGLSRKNH